MPFKTRVTEMLGIEHPIVQGGMQNVGYAELASAVSNAGGLGLITALTQPSPEALAAEIERCRSMTSKPFGVNLTYLPTLNAPDYGAFAKVIINAGITIVETAGSPKVREIWEMMKPHGIKIVHKCTSVRHALSAEKHGCDIISIDGFECAGHPGEDDVGGLVLIPAAKDKVKIPLLASGGIGDARGFVAALALGAEGINMGTRFCATKEAPIHDNIKRALVEATERDTKLVFRTLRNTGRVLKNGISEEVIGIESRPGGCEFSDIQPLVAGARGKAALSSGAVDDGLVWASQAIGLIDDIPSCEELISRMMADCREAIECGARAFAA